MRRQAGEDVMRILPHRLGHDERRVGVHLAKNFETLALAGDEAVLLLGLERMRAPDAEAFRFQGGPERCLHRDLRRPANLIGGEA